MASNSFTTVTTQNFGQRIGSSILAVLLGPLFIIGAAVLLFFNESNAVKEANSLSEGASTVVEADAAQVDPAREGKLVHLTGETKTEAALTDPDFGVSSPGIRLVRAVEVFEWTETSHSDTTTSATGTKTTRTRYDYETKWQDRLISSSSFKESAGHNNPSSLAYPKKEFKAEAVTFGAFQLDSALVDKIDTSNPLPLTDDAVKLPDGALLQPGGVIYVGGDPKTPVVGDLRITEKVTPNCTVSVVAAQKASVLSTYQTKNGGNIALLSVGTQNAAEMFQAAQSANRILAWILRGVGFALLFFGILMIFGPLSTLASIVPILGAVFEGGVFIISLLLALVGWFLLVGAAWLTARPMLAVPLFIVAFLAVASLVWLLIKRHAARTVRLAGTVPGNVPPASA